MILAATDAQVKKMAVLAINASKPMGLGYLHYKPGDISPDVIEMGGEELYIDYYEGRMVKFFGRKKEEGKWEFRDDVNPDYQSWCMKYNGYDALFKEVTAEAPKS